MQQPKNSLKVVRSSLNIVDFWIRIFMLMILGEFFVGFAIATKWPDHPGLILGETFFFPLLIYAIFLVAVRPSVLMIADTAEDAVEGLIQKVQSTFRFPKGHFGELLRKARIIVGGRILLGLLLAYVHPPETKPGDVPFALAFGLGLLALWLLWPTRIRRWAKWAIIVAVVIMAMGGSSEVIRKKNVLQEETYTRWQRHFQYVHGLMGQLMPSTLGRIDVNMPPVTPQSSSIWYIFPSPYSELNVDYPNTMKDVIDMEVMYMDGSREMMHIYQIPPRAVARVRFINRGIIEAPVKLWYIPRPQ